MASKKEKKEVILREASYTVKWIDYPDGNKVIRINDGFSWIELLGILDLIRSEILEQVKGTVHPKIIERNVVEGSHDKSVDLAVARLWIEKGKKVLEKKYHNLWEEVVPIRLSDLYGGMELGACLEIVAALNSGSRLDMAKEILDKQGHSGLSYGLVVSMVISFCSRGSEFAKYLK